MSNLQIAQLIYQMYNTTNEQERQSIMDLLEKLGKCLAHLECLLKMC